MHQVTVSDIADLCMAPRASATNDIARYANSLLRYSVLGTLDRGGGAHSVNSGRAPAGLSAWPWLGIAAPRGHRGLVQLLFLALFHFSLEEPCRLLTANCVRRKDFTKLPVESQIASTC